MSRHPKIGFHCSSTLSLLTRYLSYRLNWQANGVIELTLDSNWHKWQCHRNLPLMLQLPHQLAVTSSCSGVGIDECLFLSDSIRQCHFLEEDQYSLGNTKANSRDTLSLTFPVADSPIHWLIYIDLCAWVHVCLYAWPLFVVLRVSFSREYSSIEMRSFKICVMSN